MNHMIQIHINVQMENIQIPMKIARLISIWKMIGMKGFQMKLRMLFK